MKRHLALILVVFPFIAFGQFKDQSEIKMISKYGSTNKEIQEILFFEGIDSYDVSFVGHNLERKHFSLIVKELWDGKITNIDTILNTAKREGISLIQSDTLKFKIIAKKFTDDKLKVFFKFDKFGNERFYNATNSLDYSLRDVGRQMKIGTGKSFPAFAYILPYEHNGLKMWCAVDSSGKDVASWGEEFGIKHYLIFDVLFE